MSHTIKEKTKLLNRVRRIRGQIEALERALDEEKGCSDVLHLAVAARGALNSLVAEVIEDHIRVHVVDDGQGRISIVSLADDDDAIGRLEHLTGSGAQDLMVIDDQHTQQPI